MTSSHPAARATTAFSGLPTVPIVRAPDACSFWHNKRPTPPAAACTRARVPGTTGKTTLASISTVKPRTNTAAAETSSSQDGSGTARAAGSSLSEAYAPYAAFTYTTRSPGENPVTPGPIAATTPAASMPGTPGNGKVRY